MKQRKFVQRQFDAFAHAYRTHAYIQNVYMLTITQTNCFLDSANHIPVAGSIFVMKAFAGGSSSEVQSKPRHSVICAHSRIAVQ